MLLLKQIYAGHNSRKPTPTALQLQCLGEDARTQSIQTDLRQ